MGILQEVGAKHVGKSMIFFVELEYGAIGSAYIFQLDMSVG